jgi:hypothetical protein
MSEYAATGGHPEVEQIAAFLDGRLEGDEREHVVAHLAGCEDCYEIFSETARFLLEEEGADAVAPEPAVEAAPPALSEGARRVLRPGHGRWRRAALVPAAVLAAAAALALVVWSPAARFLGFGAEAPRSVADLADGLPVENAASTLAGTWDQHGWPVMRGAGPALGPEEERAFQIGVRVLEMDVALAAGDGELATHLTHDLETRLAAIELADPLRVLYASETGIRGRLAAGEAPAELLPLNRQGDQLLAPDEDDDYPGFVDGFWYGLGRWAGAAHLAAAAGDSNFFEARRNRRFLHGVAERELPVEIAGPVRRLDALLAKSGAAPLPQVRRELETLIASAGGGAATEPAEEDDAATPISAGDRARD